MELHHLRIKMSQYKKIFNGIVQFDLRLKESFKLGDLIEYEVEYGELSHNSRVIFKITDIITDEALKEGYCILALKMLK